MGAMLATFFTVVIVAISSIFVSGQLSTGKSLAPNAPSSKPAAAITCASGTFSCGSFCCKNNSESCGSSSCVSRDKKPTATPTPTSSPSQNSCDSSSSSVCVGHNAGDVVNCNHQTGLALTCTKTSGNHCSAIANATCENYSAPTTNPSCSCVGGVLTGADCPAAARGQACSVSITVTPSTKPKLTVTTTITPTSSSTCQCINNKYVGTGCGHSAGLACSAEPKSCNNTTCAQSCSKGASGYTGHCVDTDCICTSLTPTATPTPYCSWYHKIICSKSCTATSDGGYCTAAASPTSAPVPSSSVYSASMVSPSVWEQIRSFLGLGKATPSVSVTPSATPAVNTEYSFAITQCYQNGGTIGPNNICVYPYHTPTAGPKTSVSPTPATISLPGRSLDNYSHPGDSETFAQTSLQVANALSYCQSLGNQSGISLRNCLCNSIDCDSAQGQALSDKIFSSSSDGNGLQCVDFVASMETLEKNGTANNCTSSGADTASELTKCPEPGYEKYDRTDSQAKLHDGDIIVWSVGGNQCDRSTNTGNCSSEGHVAICVQASADGKSCTVAESNWNNDQTVTTDRTVSLSGTGEENAFDVIIHRPAE